MSTLGGLSRKKSFDKVSKELAIDVIQYRTRSQEQYVTRFASSALLCGKLMVIDDLMLAEWTIYCAFDCYGVLLLWLLVFGSVVLDSRRRRLKC